MHAPRHTSNGHPKTFWTGTRAEIDRCNHAVEERTGMPIQVYKLIKAVTQLLAVGAAIHAMTLDVQPLYALAVVALAIGGPELFEMIITDQDAE
jgi:hypothetical protein